MRLELLLDCLDLDGEVFVSAVGFDDPLDLGEVLFARWDRESVDAAVEIIRLDDDLAGGLLTAVRFVAVFG